MGPGKKAFSKNGVIIVPGGKLMATLEMNGPHTFDSKTLDSVLKDWCIGNYALGYLKDPKTFIVCYVGRATEQSLKDRLKQHLGEHPEKYKLFKYSYASSEKEAYLKECRNYHDFGENKLLVNDIHPAKLSDDDTPCPICGE